MVAIPYVWVLAVDWNRGPSLLRTQIPTGYTENFYDLQARAVLAGHLYVPKDPLGIEAWMHNGHAFTYFGLFPSLLRIPVLLVTHSLDGRLTALSLLCSWLVTGAFVGLLLWRVRVMLRGSVTLGWSEAIACGVLMASVLGGSVLMFLASTPFVYSEDKAWSVALTIGAFFALVGVVERPTWGRVVFSGILVTLTSLTRLTEAAACILGAIVVALWFTRNRRANGDRRWWVPMMGVAVVAGALACLVNWLKFGTLVGLPVHDYAAFQFLHQSAINGGKYFAPQYVPSDAFAYFTPVGIHLTSVFPFVTLPPGPPVAVGHVLFDNRARTASITASMPLLVVLALVGVACLFRRRLGTNESALRLLILAAATGAAGVLAYGWIANRYLADFLPFLVLAASIGLTLLWRRLVRESRRLRLAVCLV